MASKTPRSATPALHHFEADAVVYRSRHGDVSCELHVVDAASDARSVREGALLVPRVLKGLGVESWLTVGTVRHVLQGHDEPTLSDAQVLELFIVRTRGHGHAGRGAAKLARAASAVKPQLE